MQLRDNLSAYVQIRRFSINYLIENIQWTMQDMLQGMDQLRDKKDAQLMMKFIREPT